MKKYCGTNNKEAVVKSYGITLLKSVKKINRNYGLRFDYFADIF
jgi:hypothetical protein